MKRAAKTLRLVLLLCAGFVLTTRQAVAQRAVTDGEDLGIMIAGTITHTNNQDNVAMIKEIQSGRVMAVKNKYTIMNKFKVKEITQKYVVLNEGNKEYLVYQNKFAGEFMKSGPAPAQPL